MTRLIHLTAADLQGLTLNQQHMMVDLSDNINAACELGQATPDQVTEALQRLLDVVGRLNESNRSRR